MNLVESLAKPPAPPKEAQCARSYNFLISLLSPTEIMLLSTACKDSIALLILLTFSSSAARGAGCSSGDCGIPCYLRDAEDSCHYRTRDDSGCSSSGDTRGLEEKLQQLNKSLSDLQDRLVKKGISK